MKWDWIECLFFHSAILAHLFLSEKLNALGVLGCILSVVGSITMVLHAPRDQSIDSVEEIWELATQSGILRKKLFYYTCLQCYIYASYSYFSKYLFLHLCSLCNIYDIGLSHCVDLDYILCTSLWPDPCNSMYKYLLIGRLTDGMYAFRRKSVCLWACLRVECLNSMLFMDR